MESGKLIYYILHPGLFFNVYNIHTENSNVEVFHSFLNMYNHGHFCKGCKCVTIKF